MTVPRWGVHEGVKYSPRRSILKVCPICGAFFLKNTRGKKKYCKELCSIKAKKMQMVSIHQRFIQNRDSFEHANYMRELYADGRLSKRTWDIGTDKVPKPELNEDGTVDWNKYHQIMQGKLHKLGLG